MTRAERLHHLHQWQAAMQDMEAQTDALDAVIGGSPDSPFFTACHALMGLATEQAAQLTGVSRDWLDDWWLAHFFGAKPMQAGLAGEPLRTLSTLEELAAIIFDDEEATA